MAFARRARNSPAARSCCDSCCGDSLGTAHSKYTLKAGLIEYSEIGFSGYEVTAGAAGGVDNFDWRLVHTSVMISEAVYFVVIFEIKFFLYPELL